MKNLILGGKSSFSSHRPPMQAQPSLQTILRQAQPLSTRTGQYHRQQEVKMQSIRGLLLASLSINLVCGLIMATVTGYVTVVLAWGFLTRDITSSSSHSPSLLDTKDNEGSTIYLGWIALFVVGIFLIYVASFGLHSARKVSIHHLLRYFWVATLGIAPLVLVTACAFDFYDISRSFLRHHWDSEALDGLRMYFCSEGAEAGGKCAAPALGPGSPGFQSVHAWCEHYHDGATDCEMIKNAALAQADKWIFYMLLGAGLQGVINLLSLLISMYLCVRLITPSVIMTYANDNISYLMILPAGCCLGIALYLFSHSGFSPDHTWFAWLFVTAGTLNLLTSFFNLLGGRLKIMRLLQACLVSHGLVVVLLIGLCSAGYVIAGALSRQGTFYTVRRAQDIACYIQLRGCCCCAQTDPLPANRCPEWTMAEIIAMIAVDFRIASLAALLAILYASGGLVTGWLVVQNWKNYHCEYI